MLNSTMVDNIIKRLKKKQLSKLIGPFNITRARLSNSIGGNEAMKNLVPKVAFSYMQPPPPHPPGFGDLFRNSKIYKIYDFFCC